MSSGAVVDSGEEGAAKLQAIKPISTGTSQAWTFHGADASNSPKINFGDRFNILRKLPRYSEVPQPP
jgi:hypothetical protein